MELKRQEVDKINAAIKLLIVLNGIETSLTYERING